MTVCTGGVQPVGRAAWGRYPRHLQARRRVGWADKSGKGIVMKLIRLATAGALALMLLAAPAQAATNTFHARTTQVTVLPPIADPAQVAANCPAGFAERGALLLRTVETVEVQTRVYSGTMHSVTDQHCSVPRPPMSKWIDGSKKVIPIQLEAGQMTLRTPSGDLLYISYRAPGVIKGDLFGLNTHTFHGPYTITGGTGVFAGATGHGSLAGQVLGTATGYTGGWEMHGTLRVPG